MGNEKMQSGSGAGGDTHESVITAARARMLQVHGVEYLHLHTEDGGELYVTRWGRPYLAQLRPESWYERTWFRAHRERLKGTSTVYRVRTRPSAQTGRSIHIVVKWNRMGQDVPLETRVLEDMINAEFNSPFEEFALVEEMRRGQYGPPDQRILSHRPLAVYVPPDRLQLWQTGRSREKINRITRKHPGVEIDILRQYIMIYEWIKGVDAVQAFEELDWPAPKLWALTGRVTRELSEKGYRVADMKPAHIIVRWKDEGGLLERHGELSYALVDFELLQRTPEHQEQAVQLKRKEYLQRQRERFEEKEQEPLPEYLHRVTIMGVDYIYGHVESTGGALWVVGKDPKLFDYFQPERWRKTQQVKLSQTHPVFYTRTKDNIMLVWKASRVGEVPEADPDQETDLPGKIQLGYNSPFEEFARALELGRLGVPVIQSRAIYMTGPSTEPGDYMSDRRRYQSHQALTTPQGEPILRPDHDYIKLWGFWNGPEGMGEQGGGLCESVNLIQAAQRELITFEQIPIFITRMQTLLGSLGYHSVGLSGHHMLLTIGPDGQIMRGADDLYETRLCNFEFVHKLPESSCPENK